MGKQMTGKPLGGRGVSTAHCATAILLRVRVDARERQQARSSPKGQHSITVNQVHHALNFLQPRVKVAHIETVTPGQALAAIMAMCIVRKCAAAPLSAHRVRKKG